MSDQLPERKILSSLHDFSRYDRQMRVQGFDEIAQKRLSNSSVLVIGAGGLGSLVLKYLAGSGIGRIGIIDNDRVEPSNLHRQIIFCEGDIGKPKAERAAEITLETNLNVNVQHFQEVFHEENAKKLCSNYDIICVCVDNFQARFLATRVCYDQQKAVTIAGVENLSGQVLSMVPGLRGCYGCLFPRLEHAPRSGKPPGVLGPTVGVISSFQALKALKLAAGMEKKNEFTHFDLENPSLFSIQIEPNPSCSICSLNAVL
jgi:molybdopterin/thiamine biosynthesis adenylyltransferase